MVNNISSVTAEHRCAGCAACIAICPREAVRLEENHAGFYEAAVDTEICNQCGRCRTVCPQVSPKTGTPIQKCELFALQSAEAETVHSCSSGGIAHELSKLALQRNEWVIGAAYDLETNRVHHIEVKNAEQLLLLDGSKYLQSDPGKTFSAAIREAKADKENKFIVFGTPCQIMGMAAASESLGVREQFLLVEIFCHGVPSYRLWDETVRTVQKKLRTERFDRVRFRYKKNDWHSYCLRIDAGGKTYYGKRETELFWQVFFENILLNDACYNCAARKDHSCADIRLGDYWGTRFQQRRDGMSAVLAITPSGEMAIQQLIESGCVESFAPGTSDEMLLAQNMEGYNQQEVHDKAMKALRMGVDVKAVVRQYRRDMTAKQTLKRVLLTASVILPDDLRAKLRKQHSVRSLKKVKNHE